MNEISALTGKLMALSMLPGIDAAALRKIAADPVFESASPERLAENNSALAQALDAPEAWSNALILAEEQAEHAARLSARVLSPLDPEYPALLAATRDDPYLLYVRRQLALNPDNSVAIIGTRRPTAHGEIVATHLVPSHHFAQQERLRRLHSCIVGAGAASCRTEPVVDVLTNCALSHPCLPSRRDRRSY